MDWDGMDWGRDFLSFFINLIQKLLKWQYVNLHFWKLVFSVSVHHPHGGDVQLKPFHVPLNYDDDDSIINDNNNDDQRSSMIT